MHSVCALLSVYLCENLNSVRCFLLFVSCCFADTARSYGPHTAFIISVFSLTLSPLCPILSLSFSSPLSVSSSPCTPCWFVLYSNFHWLKLERAETDKTWAWRRRSRGWWRDADGGCLWEGWNNRPTDIRESHWREKWYESCCAVFFFFFISRSLFLSPCVPHPFFYFCRKRKGSLSAETHCSFDLGDQDKSKQKWKCAFRSSTQHKWNNPKSCLYQTAFCVMSCTEIHL